MALTDRGSSLLRELQSVTRPTSRQAAQAEALRRFGNASPAEQAVILTVQARAARASASGSGDALGADILDALDQFPDADPRVLRVLCVAGIKADMLARAIRLLEQDEQQTLEELGQEAAQLSQDLPDMFVGEAPSPSGRRRPVDSRPSGVPPHTRATGGASTSDRGRELAVEQGWIKPDNSGDAA